VFLGEQRAADGETKMAKYGHGRTGVTMNLVPDSKHGVVSQDPESTLATMGGIANVLGDIAVGVPTKIVVRVGADAFTYPEEPYQTDDPPTGKPHEANVFTKDCPHKLRLLQVAVQSQACMPAYWMGSAVLDLKVQHGDGAAGETFNDILADYDLGGGLSAGEGAIIAPSATVPLVLAYQTIDAGESLKVTMSAYPSKAEETQPHEHGLIAVWMDVILTVMRVN
ncbi:unnamed protein product, partial [marine sediment metagenome]